MSALAGFCALGHFDLNLSCTDQIPTRYAETSARHLFDCRASVVIGSRGFQTLIALAAFTAVGFAV